MNEEARGIEGAAPPADIAGKEVAELLASGRAAEAVLGPGAEGAAPASSACVADPLVLGDLPEIALALADSAQPADTLDGSDAEDPWLTDREQWVWRAFLRASRLLDEVLDADMRGHGVSLSEYEILAMLSEAPPAGLRMSALAELVVQSRSRLSHTALRLERRKLVRRRPTPGDGRGVELSLTKAGRKAVQELSPVHVASVRAHLIDLLEPEELELLGRAMLRVRAKILDIEVDDNEIVR